MTILQMCIIFKDHILRWPMQLCYFILQSQVGEKKKQLIFENLVLYQSLEGKKFLPYLF